MHLSAAPKLILPLLMAAMAGCATVATDVTVFDQTQKFAPTENVAVLLQDPPEPHMKLALIEARGVAGGSEAELFEAARKRARELGAHAIVRLEVNAVYQPPVRVFDPTYNYPFYGPYWGPWRYGYGPHFAHPFGMPIYPYDSYRWIGGGEVQTLKAMAIRYTAGNG